ncbi:late competence protein ComER [Peribacillus saganii]|uniref:Late competence protein ComER n=1 Tax=Peribacillus saganii TaxID=2303992 RepID=A0A372LTY9_9BACI|nr:late competence protein ComER [Peribacillus saganii]RFU71659.1 late competence protein ComER [Peribacillus saganii]
MKIGVIGTGNMGTILIEALLSSEAVSPDCLTVTNRTLSKANRLQEIYPGITVADTAAETAKQSDLLFICVKPGDIFNVLIDIKPFVNTSKCIVSITSPISVEQLESVMPCSCARFIPSITNRVLSGVTLLTFGNNCVQGWHEELQKIAAKISTPVSIENNITRVASDIVSCGPAFFSFLAQSFISAACKVTPIDKKTATLLTESMLIGLGDLLKKGVYTLPTLQEKVCVKGGITGEGINVMESAETEAIFEMLFQATQKKFAEEIEKVEKQFGALK